MINFNTENLIILSYIPGSGGKFLINSLGLSDDVVFQDAHLAVRQLESKFNQQDKFNYLMTKLKETEKWNDLGLGCQQLFGIPNLSYFLYPEILSKFDYHNFNEVIDPLSNSDKKFFLVADSPKSIKNYLTVWPNAKIIALINCMEFSKFRNNFKDSIENNILDDYYNTSIKELEYNVLSHWDTKWYFDEKKTIEGIKNLYQLLKLNNYNEELILSYYQTWMEVLTKIKKT